MQKQQKGLCLICRQQMKPPVVDHNHTSGIVRGLLCRACNQGIGLLKDDRRIIKRAASYLERTNGKSKNNTVGR